ncbi:hypothetical protein BJX99DRAFT_218420 [Aspergillus californicus]
MSTHTTPLTVLITGAAGGLGKVIATAFLDTGSNVAICDINKERLDGTANEWAKQPQYSDKFLVRYADTTSLSDVQALVDATTSKFGRLDILINNAAILDKFDPAGTLQREMWDRIIAVNLTGPYICTQVAVNAMQAQEPAGGGIINMGSNASISGTDGGMAYTVSKHGLLGMTRNTAAFYLEHGITCSMLQLGGLAPTNITEAMANGVNEEGLALIDKHMPGFKPGVNDVPLRDVAKFCVFLADREIAKTMNGACIPFNRNWPAGV